jgi:hypothetical protein
LTPDIVKVVECHLINFKDSNFKKNESSWKKIDSKELLNDVFAKVVQQILFDEQLVKIEGEIDLPRAIGDYVNLSMRAGFSIGNLLSFELTNKFGIGPLCSSIDKLYAKLKDICWD